MILTTDEELSLNGETAVAVIGTIIRRENDFFRGNAVATVGGVEFGSSSEFTCLGNACDNGRPGTHRGRIRQPSSSSELPLGQGRAYRGSCECCGSCSGIAARLPEFRGILLSKRLLLAPGAGSACDEHASVERAR